MSLYHDWQDRMDRAAWWEFELHRLSIVFGLLRERLRR